MAKEWIFLIGGNQDGSVSSVNELGYSVAMVADSRLAISNSAVEASKLIVSADFSKPETIRAACENLIFLLGIPILVISFNEIAIPIANELSERLLLPRHLEDTISCIYNKGEMRNILKETNTLNVFYSTGNIQEIYKVITKNQKLFPLILKPTQGSGSKNISLVKNYDDFENWYKANEKSEIYWIAESYVEGIEYSVEVISFNRKHHVLGITDKITSGKPYFVEVGHIFPAILEEKIETKIQEVVIQCLNTLDVSTGCTHTEVKVTPNLEVFIIETHVRPGGGHIPELIFQAHGLDVYKLSIACFLGIKCSLAKTRDRAAGIRFFVTQKGYLQGIQYNHFPEIDSVKRWSFIREIGQTVIDTKDSFSRLGYVICTGENSFIVKQNLQSAMNSTVIKTSSNL